MDLNCKLHTKHDLKTVFLMALFAFSQPSPCCWGSEGGCHEKHLTEMMFVQRNMGNAETFQGMGIFQQDSLVDSG